MKKSIHGMYSAKYLLFIDECDEALLQRAFSRVDETRRKKAERMRSAKSRAACLGAGLLLQLAVGEALCGTGGGLDSFNERQSGLLNRANASMPNGMRCYSMCELLDVLAEAPCISIKYRYNENGKPYFAELPFYFNLSHSGRYILCGLSEEEIGADIQQHCTCDRRRLADRFFSEREKAALAACGEDENLFFRLWARKEAYGKLTGEGVAHVLDMDLMTGKHILLNGRRAEFEEIGDIAGYSIAFCRYTEMDERVISRSRPGTGQRYPAGEAARRACHWPPGQNRPWAERNCQAQSGRRAYVPPERKRRA